MTGGALPSGLALTGDGALVGNPTAEVTSRFTVAVTDGTGTSTTQRVGLVVQPAPSGWWGVLLHWLWRIITWLGYLLLVLTLWTIVFGAGPSDGHRGLIHLFRN